MKNKPSKSKRNVITIRDVARKAGVSIATVSRALHSPEGVREAARVRVEEAAKELNYLPNTVARSLRMSKTQVVGVIVTDIENPFFTSVVRSIENVLLESDYFLILFNSDEDEEREKILLKILRGENVAGIILVPSIKDSTVYRELMGLGIPLVAIDRLPPSDLDIDRVSITNEAGAYDAVKYLIEIGHSRIGLVSGPLQHSTATDRKSGYERALNEYSIAIRPELITYGDFKQEGGYQAMMKLLELEAPPTAVLTGNNLMTLGALQAIHEKHLIVPDQISLIGYDDMPWGMSLQPPLSAIAQPTNELGTTAARLLLERLQKPQKKFDHIELNTKLVLRASAKSPMHS